ncbi:MAG: polysaccharide deacetylase family protein [Casimicrobiaceae bacterium]
MNRVALARSLGAALLAVLASCATPPPPPPEPPPPAPPAVDPGPVLGRDNDYVIVSVRAGETMASLAERYLGDAGKAWWIAQFNNATTLRDGQIVVIPLRQRNPIGVFANGYQTVPILCYHRFGVKTSKLNVTPAAFEQQMEWLARNGYTVVTFARLARFLEGKEALPPKSVVITIDDGYRSSYEIAYPILKKFGFPATVFLYTDFVGASDAMTWAQMKEMTASGLVTIQPHSKSHANLTQRLPNESEARYRERVRREVTTPVAALRDRLSEPSYTFAYPYGDVNEYVVDLLIKDNVSQGVTVTAGGNPFYAYPYMLRRSMVFGNEDLDAFKAKLVTFVRTASR